MRGTALWRVFLVFVAACSPSNAPPTDAALPMDAAQEPMDREDPGRCTPGRSVACACSDGRMGSQVCGDDFRFDRCECTGPDGGRETGLDAGEDVRSDGPRDTTVEDRAAADAGTEGGARLPPRLITPLSAGRVTSQRPTLRWVLPEGITRARVSLCGDRACLRTLQTLDVVGEHARPPERLSPGVVFWKVQGLREDGPVAWTSATWEFLVGRRDAPNDTSFGTLKDFNGDGYDEVVTSSQTRIPAVIIFRGSATSVSGAPGARIRVVDPRPDDSGAVGGAFAAGDFNGDGIADLAIQSYGRSPSLGVAYVAYGSPREEGFTSLVFLYSARGILRLGSPGDLNGDGFSDLVVLRQYLEREGLLEVLLFLGGPSGLSVDPSSGHPLRFPYSGDLFSGGDVDRDGYADLAIMDGGPMILRGGPAGFVGELRIPGFLARDLAIVGDLNGDQYSDIALKGSGEVRIIAGAPEGTTLRLVATLTSPDPTAEGYFGTLPTGGGDGNGDGFGELVIGAPEAGPGGLMPAHGRAYFYHGMSDPSRLEVRSLVDGAALGLRRTGLASTVAVVGDVNGDGFDDAAVGSPLGSLSLDVHGGAVVVLHGGPEGYSPGSSVLITNDTSPTLGSIGGRLL